MKKVESRIVEISEDVLEGCTKLFDHLCTMPVHEFSDWVDRFDADDIDFERQKEIMRLLLVDAGVGVAKKPLSRKKKVVTLASHHENG